MEQSKPKQLVMTALCNIESREDFAAAFSAARRELQISDNELAKTFQVSRPTIDRWAQGRSAPHPIGREPILLYLLGMLDAKECEL